MFKKSINDVIAVFTKSIKDLETIEIANRSKSIANSQAIVILNQDNTELNTEFERSVAIRTKIQALISN